MGKLLNEEQTRRAVEAMRAYLAAPSNADGRPLQEAQADRDRRRAAVIESDLQPLLRDYLAGQVALAEFKTKIDGINKRNDFWGFKGIKGQMFFNLVVNVADKLDECNQELKSAIVAPASEEMAASRIKTFASYVRRIGEQHVEGGGSKQGRPKVGSIPFFLSYFWQIQDRTVWPVFYTNSVNTMTDLNLWQPTEELPADYLAFKHIQEELARVFSKESGRPFGLYDVEHVFWFKGGNPYAAYKALARKDSAEESGPLAAAEDVSHLPESYVPPVVAILPRMAWNEDALREAAKASGTSLERAFEKSINAAFTILGYEAKLLGQGQGRVQDGLAMDLDASYAILWDCKARGNGYSMGTDDRTIKEYIKSQSRELKRRRGIRNIYYFIISSKFADDFDDAIRSIKMETDVNEVCLVEAEALVAMVNARMRDPLQVTLGPDGLQQLFTMSGVLTAEKVNETLL
jgi:hypothetical protein